MSLLIILIHELDLGWPQEKKSKKITFSIFTVFTADMVEEKGAPPGKNGKKH